MTLAIFLSNKLISCDTVLPLAMEVHAVNRKPVRFFTTDPATFDAIKSNTVLWDAIHGIGSLTLLGSRRRKPARYLSKLRAAAILARIALAARLGLTKVLHFRALNEPPLHWLARIAPDAVFFCESDSYGESDLMLKVAGVRNRATAKPRGNSYVQFSDHWAWQNIEGVRRYKFGPTRTRKIWQQYATETADRHSLPKDAIVFMLGYLGPLPYMRAPDSTLSLFHRTMSILREESEGRPILLKPHVFTDMEIVSKAVAGIDNARIVNIHPSVLAVRSSVFVANYYSTTLADAHLAGVPTIEFTDYSDAALAITQGGSMRPEYVSYFTSHEAQFRDAIRAAFKAARGARQEGRSGDPSGLIECLAR